MNEQNEIVDAKEDITTDSTETIEENNNEPQEEKHTKKVKKTNKHKEALALVTQAKNMAKEADDQTQACKLLLVDDLKEYAEAKVSLQKGGMDVCAELIEKLGYKNKNDVNDSFAKDTVVFEPKEEIAPITLKNVTSGKFTGTIYALLGGIVSATGLIYLATEKLGITLDISKIPSEETTVSILSWFSNIIGVESNIYVGTSIFFITIICIMALIYFVRVSLQGSKNLYFAVKQLVEAEVYAEEKGNCKEEMDKVDAHMKESVETLKMYEVLFNEQKGKLERILHIEGSKEKSTQYHEKSFLEIRETKEMIRTMKDFTSTPMSDDGRLSDTSIQFLKRAKIQIDKMLERLY